VASERPVPSQFSTPATISICLKLARGLVERYDLELEATE
jgi:hypothetical protein